MTDLVDTNTLAYSGRALTAAQQAAASVGQGLLVHRYQEEFARHDLVTGQVLLTVDDVTRRAHYRNAHQTFAKLLELGVLPIVNENDTVATDEIRFGDNDRLAALVAHLVQADALLLLSNVPGLLRNYPDESSLIASIPADRVEDYLEFAKDRMKKKVLGAAEAVQGGVKRVIFGDARVSNPVTQALEGRGTVVS